MTHLRFFVPNIRAHTEDENDDKIASFVIIAEVR